MLFEFQTHVIYQIIGKHINDVLVYPIPRLENNNKGSLCLLFIKCRRSCFHLPSPSDIQSTHFKLFPLSSALPVVPLISLQCNISAPHHMACSLPFLSTLGPSLSEQSPLLQCSWPLHVFSTWSFLSIYVCLCCSSFQRVCIFKVHLLSSLH